MDEEVVSGQLGESEGVSSTVEEQEEGESKETEGEVEKPYHKDPRFQQLIKEKNELKLENERLKQQVDDLELWRDASNLSDKEGEEDISSLKKKISGLETELVQQRMEQEFRDLLPKFPTIQPIDEDRTYIKALMLVNPSLTMEGAMEMLHSDRVKRDGKVISDYLNKKAKPISSSFSRGNIPLGKKPKEPETFEEAKKIAQELLKEVI